MTRTSLMQGRTSSVLTEWDVMWQRPTMLHAPATTSGILYFHGSGNTAQTVFTEPIQNAMLTTLSKHHVVIAADFALQAWGNDAAIARAVEAMNYGEANLGVTGPWTFISGSMGMSNACATALAYPSRVRAIAGTIPLIDIVDIMARGAYADVNAAYGGAYSDVTHGPTHNPIRMATTLPADLPIHLWCADDDPLVPIARAQDFVAARPQTGLTHLGNLSHTNAAIGAAAPEVIEFVNSHS